MVSFTQAQTHIFREFTNSLGKLSEAAETVASHYEDYVTGDDIDRDFLVIQEVRTITEHLTELDAIAAGHPAFATVSHIDDVAWFVSEVQSGARNLAAAIRAELVRPIAHDSEPVTNQRSNPIPSAGAGAYSPGTV